MGDGWSFSYSDRMLLNTNTNQGHTHDVVWFTDTGLELTFLSSDGISFTTPNSIYGALAATMSGSTITGYAWTDKTGGTVTFDSTGRLLSVADRYGNGVSVSYDDGSSRITYVRDLQNSSTRYLQFTYTGNRITQVSDFTGRSWTYTYDSVTSQLSTMTAPIATGETAVKTQYAYFTDTARNNLLQSVKDPNASAATTAYYTAQFSYYANRRGFQVTDAAGNVQSFSFNLFRNRTAQTDSRGLTTYVDYDSDGNVTQQLNPDRTTETSNYNAKDQKLSDTDAYGQIESFTYSTDGKGNLLTFTDRLGRLNTTYTYASNNFSEVATVTNNLDNGVTQNTYNSSGDLTSSAADFGDSSLNGGLGNVTNYYYPGMIGIQGTDRGLPTAMMLPSGSGASSYVTWYLYNIAGQLITKSTQVAGSSFYPPVGIPIYGPFAGPADTYITQGWSYDNAGNLTSSTDGNGFDSQGNPFNSGNTTNYTNIDPLGRVGTETQPIPGFGVSIAPVTNFAFDPNGNLLSTTLQTASPAPRTSSAVFDGLNRAVKSVNPDLTYTTEEFDPAGNLVYSTDAMGRITQFVYDSRNRLIDTILPGGTGSAQGGTGSATSASAAIIRTQYDGGSRVVASTDANGNTVRTSYDQLGRKTGEIAPYMNSPQAGPTIDDSASPPANGGSGFSTSANSGWSSSGSGAGGFNGEYKYTTNTGTGVSATWTFTGLPGNSAFGQESFYEVYVTWAAASTNTAIAKFATPDAGDGNKAAYVNETLAPSPSPLFTDGAWQQLPVLLRCSGGTLSVTLTNAAGSGTLVADAVRIVQVTPTFYGYNDQADTSTITVGGYAGDLNHTTETDTDKLGRVTKVIQPAPSSGAARPTTTSTYDPNGNVLTVTRPRGQGQTDFDATTFVYDESNRKIAQVEADPVPGGGTSGDLTTQFFYDNNGNLTYVVNAGDPNQWSGGALNRSAWQDAAYATQTVYDNLNREIASIGPTDRNLPTATIDDTAATLLPVSGNNWTSVSDPSAYGGSYHRATGGGAINTATWTFNNLQPGHYYRVFATWIVNVNNSLEPYQVLDGSTVVGGVSEDQSSPPADSTTFTDASWSNLGAFYIAGSTLSVKLTAAPTFNNPYTVADAVKIVEVVERLKTFDQDGNLISTTDSNGNTTHYVYNLHNERIGVTDTLDHTTTTMYDAVGNVLSVTSPAPVAAAPSPNPSIANPQTWFVYDPMNRKIQQTDPSPQPLAPSPSTSWSYDPNGNVTSTVDALGNRTYTQYNGWNLPVATTDALGAYNGDPQHTVTTSYDAWGRAVSMTDQLGRTSQVVYDNLGRKIETIDPDPATGQADGAGPKMFFAYDLDGNLRYTTDALGASSGDPGHTTWNFYDGLNRPTYVADALAFTTATAPSTDLAPPAGTQHVTSTTYDKLGNVSTVTQSVNGSTTRTTLFQYDKDSRKIEEVDADPTSGTASTSDPACPKTFFSYDQNGNLLSTTDADGHTSYTVYDALNRPIRSVDALGSGPNDLAHATVTTYDPAGNVASVTDADANTTSYVRDRWNRPVQTLDALGNVTTVQYDLNGNVTQKTDRAGRVTQFIYDPLNRQVEEDWMSGTTITHATHTYFDPAGQVIGITDPGASYQYSYDADGRVTSSRMAPGDLSELVPNTSTDTLVSGQSSGNSPTADWNATGTQKPYKIWGNFTFNAGDTVFLTVTSAAFDPVVIAQDPSGSPAKWLIDDNSDGGHNSYLRFVVPQGEGGNTWLIIVTSPSAMASGAYTLSVLDNPNPFVPTSLTELDYKYNADGTVHTVIDKSDVSALSGKSGTTTSGYDALARLTQITQQNTTTDGITSKHVEFTYNDDSSVDTITRYNSSFADSTKVVATTKYRTTAGIATAGSGYDGMGRLIAMQQTFNYSSNPPTTHTYTWQYDSASNIIGATASADGSDTYALDNTNQLKGATGTLTNENYTYDANGNRLTNGSAMQSTGPNNQLKFDGTYTYTYDNEGNRTAKFIDADHATDPNGAPASSDTNVTVYTWDYRNRLVEEVFESAFGAAATKDIHYTYDAEDRLIGSYDSVSGASSRQYTVYDGSNPYLVVKDPNALANNGAGASISQRDLYGQAVDEILATDDLSGAAAGVRWGLGDNQGTPRDVVDSTGALVNHVQYTSFGAPTAGTGILATFAFGQAGMRYNLSTGNYQTASRILDPLADRFLSEDPTPLSGTEPTIYGNNNALVYSDPSGLCPAGYGATSTLVNDYGNGGVTTLSNYNGFNGYLAPIGPYTPPIGIPNFEGGVESRVISASGNGAAPSPYSASQRASVLTDALGATSSGVPISLLANESTGGSNVPGSTSSGFSQLVDSYAAATNLRFDAGSVPVVYSAVDDSAPLASGDFVSSFDASSSRSFSSTALGVLDFWQGMNIDGPLNLVRGIANMNAHPLDTLEGIANQNAHPIDTANALWNHYANEATTARGQGRMVFDAGTVIVPGALELREAELAGQDAQLMDEARLAQDANAGRGAAPSAPTGGRLGSASTRAQVADIQAELRTRGWNVTDGGVLGEEYIPGPGNARAGSAYPDITATKNGRTLRINTVDTLSDGVTPTAREAANAAKIRALKPNDHLLLIPKRR